jgi:superfamily II DNA or RNA helicase
LVKSLGLKTLVIAPTKSIAGQIVKELTEAFGKKYVGMIGNTKRVLTKKITVAIGASLVQLEDPEEIKEIQRNQVLITDESHLFAADTLKKVAVELCGNIPYRFFVSATQMRGDGRDLLLESIIGEIVYSKTYRELVDEGFLADLDVNFILMKSRSDYHSQNSVRMSQRHYLYNKDVLAYAAQLINEVQAKGEPTMALCDEHEQLHMLSQQLKYTYEVASADTDVSKVVESFNNGSCKLLLGTSAIGMGSDTKPVKHLFVLQYGSSEVAFAQALGRATRLVPGKTSCKVYIFCVIEGFASGANHFKKLRNMIENMDIKTKLHDFRGN